MPPFLPQEEKRMLDDLYWKLIFRLSVWWVKESEKIDKAAARFKQWLDGK